MFCFMGAPATADAQVTHVKPGWWKVSAAYPTFSETSSVARAANRHSRTREQEIANAFLNQATSDLPSLKNYGFSGYYELLVKPSRALDTSTWCTGYVTIYRYTGGAHGSTTFEVLNFDANGKKLELKDIFVAGVNPVKEATFGVLSQLLKSNLGSSVSSGAWSGLSKEQANRFVVTEDGLMFLFNQGEIGAESEGGIKVVVPYSELHGVRDDLVKGLLSLTARTWELQSIEMNDDSVLRPEAGGRYELQFLPGGQLSGSAGANRIWGEYHRGGIDFSNLRMGPIASTKMADPPGSIAPRYLELLQSITGYLIRDGKLALQLPYDGGVILFRPKR